jgi:hypothetical protein
MNAMLEPRMAAANTQGFARSAQPGVAAAARITPSSHGARPRLIIGYAAICRLLPFYAILIAAKH